MNHYYLCNACRKAFAVLTGSPRVCPHCGEKNFSLRTDARDTISDDFKKQLFDVPDEIEETLGEELRDTFKKLMPKMVAGKKEHGDESLELPLSALLDEIDDELLDVFGWGVIARRKVNVLRGVVKILEQRVEEMHDRRINPVYLRDVKEGEEGMVRYEPHPLPTLWREIESAPQGQKVLVPMNGRAVIAVLLHGPDPVWCLNGVLGDLLPNEPTHWHPLPDPPDGTLYQKPKL